MKSGKDEEKKMDPLFPRLHTSDAEKLVGPRAPPRNKMALYEKLGVPTQRFKPRSVSLFSLPPNHGTSFLPSSSSNNVTSYKRSVFSSFGNSSGSTRLAARLGHYNSGGMSMNTALRTVWQPIETTTHCQSLCGTGHLKPSDYPFKPQSFTKSKTSSVKKIGHEGDYIVPTLSNCGNGQHITNREKFTSFSTNSDGKLPTPSKKQTEENKLVTKMSKDCAKEPAPVFSARLCISEPVNNELAPLHLKKRNLLVDESSILHDPNARLQQKHSILQENIAHRDVVWAEPENATRKRSASEMDGLSGNIGKFSNASVEDSMSGLDIFPDEVVDLIGRKHFLHARRTIAHQQRVFALQIFELHRLIKVQRLIAGSPDLLLGAGFYVGIPSADASTLKKLPSKDILVPSPSRVNSPRTDRKSHPINNDVDKRFTHQSNLKGNLVISPPLSSTASESKLGPQYFHPPPGNQWLIPVRSPSEGLIYKPYTGPCPPSAGLVAPIMNLTPVNENFPNTPYGFTTSYQQGIGIFPSTPINHTYFPPYSWPMIKSPSVDSVVDGSNPFSIIPSNGANINFSLPYKPSCSISSPEKCDLQGGSASSPLEKKQGGDELPLFPTAPTVQDLDHTAQSKSFNERIKVIKVVPHNPTLALESAARIFRSIQKERTTSLYHFTAK